MYITESDRQLFSGKIFLVFASALLVAYTPGGAFMLFIALALYALRGSKQTIQALTLTWLLLFLNKGLFPEVGGAAGLRWIVLLAGAIAVARDTQSQRRSFPAVGIAILVFSCVVLITSAIVSNYPVVSIFKVIQFFVGSIVVILSFQLTSRLYAYWVTWFSTLFAIVVVVSLPLYFLDAGFLANQKGFQGILNQPQAFGIFLAPLTAFYTGLLFDKANRSRILIMLVSLGWICIFASLARTAFFAVLLGVSFSILSFTLVKRKLKNKMMQRYPLSISTFSIIIFVGVFSVANYSDVQNRLTEFLEKDAINVSLSDQFEVSRGMKIENSFDEFTRSPWMGIGFGIASSADEMNVEVNETFGIPIGAPVEKGFLPTAILEETGIIGASFLLILLIILSTPVIKHGNLSLCFLFFTCLFVNIGEMIFFSFGGMGLYSWLLMGLVLSGAAGGKVSYSSSSFSLENKD